MNLHTFLFLHLMENAGLENYLISLASSSPSHTHIGAVLSAIKMFGAAKSISNNAPHPGGYTHSGHRAWVCVSLTNPLEIDDYYVSCFLILDLLFSLKGAEPSYFCAIGLVPEFSRAKPPCQLHDSANDM